MQRRLDAFQVGFGASSPPHPECVELLAGETQGPTLPSSHGLSGGWSQHT